MGNRAGKLALWYFGVIAALVLLGIGCGYGFAIRTPITYSATATLSIPPAMGSEKSIVAPDMIGIVNSEAVFARARKLAGLPSTEKLAGTFTFAFPGVSDKSPKVGEVQLTANARSGRQAMKRVKGLVLALAAEVNLIRGSEDRKGSSNLRELKELRAGAAAYSRRMAGLREIIKEQDRDNPAVAAMAADLLYLFRLHRQQLDVQLSGRRRSPLAGKVTLPKTATESRADAQKYATVGGLLGALLGVVLVLGWEFVAAWRTARNVSQDYGNRDPGNTLS